MLLLLLSLNFHLHQEGTLRGRTTWPEHHLSISTTDASVELLAFQNKAIVTGVDDATLGGNGASGVHVVACHHAHTDSCRLAPTDGFWHLQGKWRCGTDYSKDQSMVMTAHRWGPKDVATITAWIKVWSWLHTLFLQLYSDSLGLFLQLYSDSLGLFLQLYSDLLGLFLQPHSDSMALFYKPHGAPFLQRAQWFTGPFSSNSTVIHWAFSSNSTVIHWAFSSNSTVIHWAFSSNSTVIHWALFFQQHSDSLGLFLSTVIHWAFFLAQWFTGPFS